MALYGSDFWSDPKETDRREDLQPLVNQHARTNLDALPTMPLSALMQDSELTLMLVDLDSRKQQFTARLANTCGGLKLMKVPDYHISDAPICSHHDRACMRPGSRDHIMA